MASTKYDRTPLWRVTGKRYKGIVKLPLEREDANSDTAEIVFSRVLVSRGEGSWNLDGGLEQPRANWAKDADDHQKELEVSRRPTEKGTADDRGSSGS